MNIAAQAIAAAIQFEVKKDGLQQRQSGDWTLRFVAQGIDMDDRLMKAAMGTRFVCVLVEVGDDELPVAKEVMPTDQPTTRVDNAPRPDSARSGGARKPLAQKLAIVANEGAFKTYLSEKHKVLFELCAGNPTVTIRDLCGVKSRADIDGNTEAEVKASALLLNYKLWLRAPEFVG